MYNNDNIQTCNAQAINRPSWNKMTYLNDLTKQQSYLKGLTTQRRLQDRWSTFLNSSGDILFEINIRFKILHVVFRQ